MTLWSDRWAAGASPHVLCLGAHADDIEIGCGATLLRLLESWPQARVRWVVFSGKGVRAEEARASAAVFLGAGDRHRVEIHEFRESFFPDQWAAIKQVFEAMKAGPAPALVFTQHKHDVHQDHRVIGDLTWNTFRDAVILEYEIPKYEDDLGSPNLFVPVPPRLAERKIDILLTHFASQRARPWFRRETFRGLMALRGMHAAAPDGFAEAFHCRKLVI